MLVAAALVPDTALLVPGVGGRVDGAGSLRDAALEAVRAAVVGAQAVVVVAPGRVTRELTGVVAASLGAAGVPDAHLRWPTPTVRLAPGPDSRAGVAAAVGLHLAVRAGWTGTTRVVEVDGAHGLDGAALVAEHPTGLVVVGSGSGRHGPDAPLADDERAAAYDDSLLRDLASADADARARVAARSADEAAVLAVTGWAPWRVLVDAAGDADVVGTLLRAEVLAGAQHAVLLWRVAAGGAA